MATFTNENGQWYRINEAGTAKTAVDVDYNTGYAYWTQSDGQKVKQDITSYIIGNDMQSKSVYLKVEEPKQQSKLQSRNNKHPKEKLRRKRVSPTVTETIDAVATQPKFIELPQEDNHKDLLQSTIHKDFQRYGIDFSTGQINYPYAPAVPQTTISSADENNTVSPYSSSPYFYKIPTEELEQRIDEGEQIVDMMRYVPFLGPMAEGTVAHAYQAAGNKDAYMQHGFNAALGGAIDFATTAFPILKGAQAATPFLANAGLATIGNYSGEYFGNKYFDNPFLGAMVGGLVTGSIPTNWRQLPQEILEKQYRRKLAELTGLDESKINLDRLMDYYSQIDALKKRGFSHLNFNPDEATKVLANLEINPTDTSEQMLQKIINQLHEDGFISSNRLEDFLSDLIKDPSIDPYSIMTPEGDPNFEGILDVLFNPSNPGIPYNDPRSPLGQFMGYGTSVYWQIPDTQFNANLLLDNGSFHVNLYNPNGVFNPSGRIMRQFAPLARAVSDHGSLRGATVSSSDLHIPFIDLAKLSRSNMNNNLPKLTGLTNEQINNLKRLILSSEPAWSNYSPSSFREIIYKGSRDRGGLFYPFSESRFTGFNNLWTQSIQSDIRKFLEGKGKIKLSSSDLNKFLEEVAKISNESDRKQIIKDWMHNYSTTGFFDADKNYINIAEKSPKYRDLYLGYRLESNPTQTIVDEFNSLFKNIEGYRPFILKNNEVYGYWPTIIYKKGGKLIPKKKENYGMGSSK